MLKHSIFSEKNAKENAVRGQGRVHFFVSHPTIKFRAVCLWNNKRINETPTQRHHCIAKRFPGNQSIKILEGNIKNDFFIRFQMYARVYLHIWTLKRIKGM